MEIIKLENLNEATIQLLFERAEIEIEGKTFIVFPDIEPEGQKFKHGGMRIKVSPTNTKDKSVSSSFPINTSSVLPYIDEDLCVYGRDLKADLKSRELKAAKATVG